MKLFRSISVYDAQGDFVESIDEMTDADNRNVLENEEYANAYHYFHKILVILSEDSIKQCEDMGYFNVAWEIKDDAVAAINSILELPGSELLQLQREKLVQLLADINAIPGTVTNVPNVKEEQIRAMKDPCWGPIRMRAKELISLLEHETKRINTLLKIQN